MTGLSYLCLLLLSGWSCLKELNGKLNMVNVSILLLKFGVLLARDKGRAACNTDSGTNYQCKGCKHPGFRVPIWSFPFRLLWSTGKFCLQGRRKTTFLSDINKLRVWAALTDLKPHCGLKGKPYFPVPAKKNFLWINYWQSQQPSQGPFLTRCMAQSCHKTPSA